MDRLLGFLATSQENWLPFRYSDQSVLQVSEIWERSTSAGTIDRKAEHRNISSTAAISEWLSQELVKNGDSQDLQQPLFDSVVQSLGLDSALQYARSLITSAMRITASPDSSQETWTVCLNPKLCTVWSRRTPHAHIDALIIAEPGAIELMKGALEATTSFADHSAFTAILCAILVSGQVQKQKDSVKTFIRTVETRTGYHRFRRTEPPAQGELAQLSASVSGHALKLASDERKARAVQEMHEFILAEDQRCHPLRGTSSEIRQLITLLDARLKMHFIDFEYMQRRIEVQLSAIFHLITRRDNHIGLQIANSSHTIAESSQRDASAMKLIAIVTMAFLPGTFVASLFDMPLFNWSTFAAPSTKVNPGFGIYWAVTIPLTAATFGIWVVWMAVQRRRERRQPKGRREGLERQTSGLAESVAVEGDELVLGIKREMDSRVTTWQAASPYVMSPVEGYFGGNGEGLKG